MALIGFSTYLIFTLIVLYRASPAFVWEIGSLIFLLSLTLLSHLSWGLLALSWLAVGLIDIIIRGQRVRQFISHALFQRMGNFIPKLSQTEEEALNIGDSWFEKDIFCGTPDWDKLLQKTTPLTAEEQAFLDNETQVLCDLLDEWSISREGDLSENAWSFIKENGFLGLVIPKEYGGKGFSARAHSEIVLKIASRSGVAAVTVMVPNSLGPGELLNHYGTEEQKGVYLPQLASGSEIPCFALTEPGAGSDATALQSEAIVVRKNINGEFIVGLNISLNKRWITLAPIATLIGLAVNLKDPDGLLNGVGREGITCLLMPRDTPNLEIGNRHLPADQAFMNGSLRGKDIFLPITSIIGGQKNAGYGWQMLVECLSVGRSISLPALSTASSSIAYLTTGAFAKIRRQFNVEIGQFEGVEEKLAEIAGLNYLINTTRLFTLEALAQHKKPAVAAAITKYFSTEFARIVVNSAMDVHAGRAVVVGPRNYLSSHYQAIPISITVEGANIMSRNLLIFGQGSMICHPYIRTEFYAIREKDKEKFHQVIWQHIFYFIHNLSKTIGSAWTGGLLIFTPKSSLRRYYQRLTRLSYAFSWIADVALIRLGARLKRKERLSARLADGLSYLYMAMAILRSYEQEQSSDHVPHARWALAYCFYHAQKSMLAFCRNFPSRGLGLLMRFIAFPFGQTMHYPSDQLDHLLAQKMMQNNAYRDSLKALVYLSGESDQPVDRMECALQLLLQHAESYRKITDLKGFKFAALKEQLVLKVNRGELSQQEMDALIATEKACWDAIQVDEFPFSSFRQNQVFSITDSLETPLD